jgi:hypothetical protein
MTNVTSHDRNFRDRNFRAMLNETSTTKVVWKMSDEWRPLHGWVHQSADGGQAEHINVTDITTFVHTDRLGTSIC